jgi:hypothetical protein
MMARNMCLDCGAVVRPDPCGHGCWHLSDRCWPCHHKRHGDATCAAPHCPVHGLIAQRAIFNRDNPDLPPIRLIDAGPNCEPPTAPGAATTADGTATPPTSKPKDDQ